MFRTKKEVDRHAADLLRRTHDDKERNSKGYQISKLYQQVGEYEIARRYLTTFLTVQDAVPQAHKVMGQICESLKDYRRAILSYEKSLQLNDNQKDVVLKVCELLLRIKVDNETVKYWIEKAESVVQGSEVVFHLKEKLIDAESDGNPTELENFFKNELVKKPGNVHIRIKLLKLYVESKRIDTAIAHAVSVDSLYIFDFNVEWYDYLVEFYSLPYVNSHMEHNPTDISVYTHKIFSHCKQLLLWLPSKDVSDITEALHAFDQLLLNVASLQFHQPQWAAFLSEMQGYFFFFSGCLLFKRALKGQTSWKEIEGAATLCFLASVGYRPIEKHSDLYLQGDVTNRLFVKYLHKMGCYRLSQVGHVLCDVVKKHSSNWIYDITVRCCTPQCKEQLYDMVFTFRDMRRGRGKSFLLSENAFNNISSTIPTKSDLKEYDQVSVLLNTTDLNTIIWLCLHYYNPTKDEAQPNYNFSLFDNLPYSTSSLSSSSSLGVESLSQLDTEVFLIAAVYSAGRLLQQVRHEPSRPHLLPKVLCRQFCTPEQVEWWQLACKFREKLELENFTKLRLILMRGLDSVRLTEGHGMSASLILHVARTLQNKATQVKVDIENGHGSLNKVENIEERAAYYWQAALPLLQRLQKNLVLKMPKVRLFPDDSDNELDTDRIKDLVGECEYHLALSYMSQGDLEEAVKIFECLSNPWASYHTAKIYRKLALLNEPSVTDQTSTVSPHSDQSRYIALLTKAKEALYITLDRLKGNKSHQLNQVIYEEIDDIEFLLTRIAINNGPFPLIDDASSTESFCSANMNVSAGITPFDSPPHEVHIRSSSPIPCRDSSLIEPEHKKSPSNKKQTPKSHRNSSEGSHVRPSPERLDAQLRALQLSHISILKPIVDQNKELTKFNVSLQQQLRESKELNQLYLTELTQYRMMASTFHLAAPGVTASPSPATPAAVAAAAAAAYMSTPTPFAAPPPPQQPTPPPHVPFTPSAASPWMAAHFTGYQLHTPLVAPHHQMQQSPYGAAATTPVAPPATAVSPKALPGAAGRQAALSPYSKVMMMMASIPSPMVTPSPAAATVFSGNAAAIVAGSGTPAVSSAASSTISAAAIAATPASAGPQEGPEAVAAGGCGEEEEEGVGEVAEEGECKEEEEEEDEEEEEEEDDEEEEDEEDEEEEEDDDEEEDEEEEEEEEDLCHVDGEYYDESNEFSRSVSPPLAVPSAAVPPALNPADTPPRFHIPDSQLVQEWPFGHQTGLVGKSTVTYSPQQPGGPLHHHHHHHHPPPPQLQQHRSPVPAPAPALPRPGYFADALRGHSLQYGYHGISPGSAGSPCVSGTGLSPGGAGLGVSPGGGLNLSFGLGSSPAPGAMTRMSLPSPGFFSADSSSVSGSNMAASTPKGMTGMGMMFPSPHSATTSPMTNPSSLQATDPQPTPPSITSPGQPVTSALLKVLNNSHQQSSEVMKASTSGTPSTNLGLTINPPEPSKGPSQSFGGFTFSCTPKVDFDATDKPTPASQKTPISMTTPAMTSSAGGTQKPFWNFSFPDTSKTSFFGKVDKTPVGDPAAVVATEIPFGSTTPSNIFSGSTSSSTTLSSCLFPSSQADTSTNKDDEVDEYEPNVNFAPVVPLPELVDVKTGEEEEEKLFGDRAKLYRFDKESNQWKERGIGELKILHNKSTNRCRVLMRREQVLKLCANHFLSADTKLTPMTSSTKAWCWNAQDFAEEELKLENFAARFKVLEVAEEFKAAFEKAQQYCALAAASDKQSNSSTPVQDITAVVNKGTAPSPAVVVTAKTTPSPAVGPTKPLSELFKMEEGSWECSTCCIVNNKDMARCVACQSANPNSKAAAPSPGLAKGGLFTQPAAPIVGVSSDKPPLSELFKDKQGTWECVGCYLVNDGDVLQCIACCTLKPGTDKKDLKSSTAAASPTSAASLSSSLITSTGFKFVTDNTTNNISKDGFKFGSGFTLGSMTKTPSFTVPVLTTTTAATTTTTTTAAALSPFSLNTCLPQPSFTTPITNHPFVFSSAETSSVFGSKTAAKTPSLKPTPNWSSPQIAPSSSMSLIVSEPSLTTTPVASSASASTILTTPSFSFGASTPPNQNSKPLGFNLSQPKFNFSLTPNTSGKGILGPGPSNAALTPGTSTAPSGSSVTASPLSTISAPGASSVTQAATPFFSFSMTPSQPDGVLSTPTDGSKGPNLSGATSPDAAAAADDGYYVNRDGEDSHINFDPIMPLPDKVEVLTGEEGEKCLFEHRAKLYRFDSAQWKERGLGNIKILENTTTQKLRLVMRREQVLKVCCNHYITADLALKPKVNSKGCVWVWCAFDSSDGGGAQLQHLSIRFKTSDIANNFKQVFEEAKQKAVAYQAAGKSGDDGSGSSNGSIGGAGSASQTNTQQVPTTSPAAGGPKPNGRKSSVVTTLFPDVDTYKTLVDSDGVDTKDDSSGDDVIFVKQVVATTEQVLKARKLMLPDNFYLYETKPPCPGCRGCDPEDLKKLQKPKQTYAAKLASTVSEGQKTLFSASTTTITTAETTATTTPITTSTTTATTTFPTESTTNMPFSRLMNNNEYSGTLFSTLAAQADTQQTPAFQKDKSKPFSWQGAGQKLFDVTPSPSAGHEDEDEDDVVTNVDIHFEPVIELPALIDQRSGEEDESPLFVQRSKLYRFDKTLNCWKEKGIGNIKILSHNGSVRFRILFRREQVLKVACNHLLTTNLVLKRMFTSETAWCWVARDYTDDKEGTVEQFAVRFKTIELATNFHKCFTECQEKLQQAESISTGSVGSDVHGVSSTLSSLSVATKGTVSDGSEERQVVEETVQEEDVAADEQDVRFEKRATLHYKVEKDWSLLGLGTLQVLSDSTFSGLRVLMTDSSDKQLCNHIITRQTNFTQCSTKHKHSGTWSTIDGASGENGQRTFRVDFSSAAAYTEFKDIFQQGKTLAKQLNLSEHSIHSS